jgi:Holliday junction resolvase
MQVVVIRDMSAGNDSVGEMWKETKIFDSKEPIENIIKWAENHKGDFGIGFKTSKNIIITVPKIEE